MSRNNKKSIYFVCIILCLLVIGGVIWGAIVLTHTQSAALGHARAVCQRTIHQAHTVTFSSTVVTPNSIRATKCDSATFVNTSPTAMLLAFGHHDNHQSYDGITEQWLFPGKSLKITLIRSGTLHFHDHDNDSLQGNIYIK